jgi:folate-dependent phosphoribosylglycinamide formyltransferase PurN
MDTGPIIFQRAIKMPLSHSYEELVAKGLEAEHQLYQYFLECWNRGIVQNSFGLEHTGRQECSYQQ